MRDHTRAVGQCQGRHQAMAAVRSRPITVRAVYANEHYNDYNDGERLRIAAGNKTKYAGLREWLWGYHGHRIGGHAQKVKMNDIISSVAWGG